MENFAGIRKQYELIGENLLNAPVEDLSELLNDLIDQDDAKMLSIINTILAIPANLYLLVNKILSNDSAFRAMANESYYHENGFHKIVLLSGQNFKLRLHHFGIAAKLPMENIHDHRWPFASTILSGDLTMDLFKKSPDKKGDEELFHFVYDSGKASGSYETTLKGKVFMNKSESRVYHTGESYLMLPDELHRIKNTTGQESVTLILTGKPINSTCNLYAKREILEKEKEIIPYEDQILKVLVESIMEKIYPHKN